MKVAAAATTAVVCRKDVMKLILQNLALPTQTVAFVVMNRNIPKKKKTTTKKPLS